MMNKNRFRTDRENIIVDGDMVEFMSQGSGPCEQKVDVMPDIAIEPAIGDVPELDSRKIQALSDIVKEVEMNIGRTSNNKILRVAEFKKTCEYFMELKDTYVNVYGAIDDARKEIIQMKTNLKEIISPQKPIDIKIPRQVHEEIISRLRNEIYTINNILSSNKILDERVSDENTQSMNINSLIKSIQETDSIYRIAVTSQFMIVNYSEILDNILLSRSSHREWAISYVNNLEKFMNIIPQRAIEIKKREDNEGCISGNIIKSRKDGPLIRFYDTNFKYFSTETKSRR